MATTNSIDPRERLVRTGNDLLDILYALDGTEQIVKPMLDAKDDDAKIKELMDAPGAAEAIISAIGNGFKRDALLREYVTLRQTIEALTTERPAMRGGEE